ALLGLLQYGSGPGSPAFLGLTIPDVARAQGTYTNPDHLSGLLEMLLPIALGLLFYSVGRGDGGRRGSLRERVAFLGSLRGHTAVLYGAIALLLLLGLIFARSRAGIALALVGILLSTLLFARRIGGSNVYGTTGTLIALALGSGIAIGLVPVLDRFSVEGAVNDARWTIYGATLEGIGTFSPLGSGPGTYPDVFPAFQPLELGRWFINHAHNDYLEWLFEAGLFAAALITLLAVLYALRWLRVLGWEEWSRLRFIQVGAGIGTLLLLIHSLVDFNLHIPANIVYFAFLLGVFGAEPEAGVEPARRHRRRTPMMEAAGLEPPPSLAPGSGERRPAPPPPDQIRNPFLDDD
ncbi:MAG: O-antigen ligase family protein, partial [Bdellovibrio bacteriovorus]